LVVSVILGDKYGVNFNVDKKIKFIIEKIEKV